MDLTSNGKLVIWGGPLRHQTHLKTMFSSLQSSSTLVDVSLICQTGEVVKCHKIVLASASPLFKKLLIESTGEDLSMILSHVSYSELVSMVEYIYKGEIAVDQSNLDTFLAAAHHLEIVGLDHLKTADRDDGRELDQGIHPQDLSMKTQLKTNKRRRMTDSYSIDTCLPIPAHQTNFQRTYDMSQNVPHCEDSIQSYRIPTGIFSANLQMNGEVSTRRFRMKEPSINPKSSPSSKLPAWTQTQLQEAIESVITQRLRFTQASSQYGIPKGTLYDNILGKSKRMAVLDQVGLTETQELSVLEFCCEISSMPYNRRTSHSLKDIIQCISGLKKEEEEKDFQLSMRQGFRWWWAFTKKHSIISLHYQEENKPNQTSRNHESRSDQSLKVKGSPRSRSSSPGDMLNILNNPSSIPIILPTSSSPLNPLFLGLKSFHPPGRLQHSTM